ncbi:phospholipase b-like 1 [Plakobranchus ocellatus]|uniref:Phospholipase B-like n=1 Tax=Plakobranchus ocellatus TaxID=259542 RepID=A0AAV4CFK6_9GAST|nr:phospholipase b-like 1 [Plakobranchus ocellatus]
MIRADKLFHSGSVTCKRLSCKFKKDELDRQKATAYGTFNDTLLVSGWGVLDIYAGDVPQRGQTNKDIMFGAGFLEGVFTAQHIEDHYANMVGALALGERLMGKLRKWFEDQQGFTNFMIQIHPTDPYWRQVSYVKAQLDGLIAGYKSVRKHSKKALDLFAFYFLNSKGDILDLRHVLSPVHSFPNWLNLTKEEAELKFHMSGHCSALIKVLPGVKNIYMSHSTWFLYSATNRIYKHYYLNVNDDSAAAKKISFSSYAGLLVSIDDFYLMDSGLVMLQTTNLVFKRELYYTVIAHTLLSWQRVRVANMMAHSGYEWCKIVGMHNSGTYNNQYMIIDLSKIDINEGIREGALWVTEQIPGLVLANDETQLLREGYFPSYNIPFFEEIYVKSGFPDMEKKHGSSYSYTNCSRAKIFRRDQAKVTDMASMKALMLSNDYKHDSISQGNPWFAICARGDLDPKKPRDDGCYDTKVNMFE